MTHVHEVAEALIGHARQVARPALLRIAEDVRGNPVGELRLGVPQRAVRLAELVGPVVLGDDPEVDLAA